MWGLHALNKLNPERYLDDPNEHIRAWAIRLMMDGQPIDTLFGPKEKGLPTTNPKLVQKLVQQARIDSSGLVRLTLASALQRLPISLRRELAKGLASRQEDANDHNLPMIVWAGITPLVENDPDGLLDIARFQPMARFTYLDCPGNHRAIEGATHSVPFIIGFNRGDNLIMLSLCLQVSSGRCWA